MSGVHKNIDELLAKYLLDETSDAQNLQLQEWRSRNPDNEKYFQDMKAILSASEAVAPLVAPDETLAWQRLQDRINKQEQQAKGAKKLFLTRRSLVAAAALLLLLISTVGSYFVLSNNAQTVSAGAVVTRQILPDGSFVTLNKNARLHYPRKFEGPTRTVSLEGEAFFEIKANKDQPFVIQANGVMVQVVGTSFNVKTSAAATEVVVETGIVEVRKSKNSIRLLPQEKALVKQQDASLVKEKVADNLYRYYRSNEFVCDHTPLSRIVAVLEEAYAVRIIIDNESIAQLPLTATFSNESLDDVLAIIANTLDLTVEKRADVYLLK